MNPAMMNPEMMKAAQDMMSKMSPEDMDKMMKMQQQMCAAHAAAETPRRERARCHPPAALVECALAGCRQTRT